MGKKDKEHRKKVAKRNAKIKQKEIQLKKSIQELLKKQSEELTNENSSTEELLNVKLGDKNLNFEINELDEKNSKNGIILNLDQEESAKINKEFEEEIPTEE